MLLEGKKLAILGAGQMGQALIGGLVRANVVSPESILATDVRPEVLRHVHTTWGVTVGTDNPNAVRQSDVVVLCVKPQTSGRVLAEIAPEIRRDHLVISIMAGIPTRLIADRLGKPVAVVRAMPNIAALVGEAVTAVAPGRHATGEHLRMAETIFGAVGRVEVVEENLMDAVTGLSGSGPAFVYTIIEALTEGGVMMGLSREVAARLSAQTVLGAAKMVRETGLHPAILRDQVTTPAGTAIHGIYSLESDGLRPMLINAVRSATKRSSELSQFLIQSADNEVSEKAA
ncbi:MAG: pyrroline-5-carboxylate reductase [candidate division KSB1 bacterium]|nr:pyrroline-5-carboxylate reductase [candidate division KSB1 bacterium]